MTPVVMSKKRAADAKRDLALVAAVAYVDEPTTLAARDALEALAVWVQAERAAGRVTA